jgi:hypothetical protein
MVPRSYFGAPRICVLLIAMVGLSQASAFAQERRSPQITQAWWITARFVPDDSLVVGVPISELSSDWTLATVLRTELLPPEAASDPSSLVNDNVDFVLDGDFNVDGNPDRAAVGVYRRDDGVEGNFVLILTNEEGKWTKAFLLQAPGKPGFLVLRVNAEGVLSASDCMECDGWRALRWYEDHYDWEPYVEPGIP